MKRHLIAAVVASVVLIIFGYLALVLMPTFFPKIAEEYYGTGFRQGDDYSIWYFAQAVVLAFALSWFWYRFKGQFKGSKILKGIEMGIVYAVIASLPAMMINYSILSVSGPLVFLWLFYGLCQGIIAGIIFAMIDP